MKTKSRRYPARDAAATKDPALQRFLDQMEKWPESWAVIDADKQLGRDFVKLLRPFVIHLVEQGLAAKTIRRHVDNLWVIIGDLIRMLHYDEEPRDKPAEALLLSAIDGDEAPLSMHATENEQRSLDATARKLYRFLVR